MVLITDKIKSPHLQRPSRRSALSLTQATSVRFDEAVDGYFEYIVSETSFLSIQLRRREIAVVGV